MAWWWMIGTALAGQPSWSTLDDAAGWTSVATRSTDAGVVQVQHRKIDGIHCLQGIAAAKVAPETLVAVATDFPSAPRWSSAGLTASEVLGRREGAVHFYQLLDIPDWTLVTDRYWILSGVTTPVGDGGRRFRWTRVDATAHYPDLHRRLTESGRVMEVPQNWGEWLFVPGAEGTDVRYRVCTDVGGSIPQWLQKLAAQRTLPDTVADLVREARRRATP